MASKLHVIVVGAGSCGLAAAQTLLASGGSNVDVQILEATQRCGGRVFHFTPEKAEGVVYKRNTETTTTATPTTVTIELGAEEIHGKKTEWYRWNTKGDADVVAVLDDDLDDYAWDEIGGKLYAETNFPPDYKDAMKMCDEIEDCKHKKSKQSVAELAASRGLSTRAIKFICSQLCGEHGGTLEELDAAALSIASDVWSSGDQNYMRQSTPLMHALERNVPLALNNVVYNTRVTSIEYKDGDGELLVKTEAGNVYKANAVIMTVPLGVLRHGDISFDPPLPEQHMTAIQSIGFSNMIKTIFQFRNQFWPGDMCLMCGSKVLTQIWPTVSRKRFDNNQAGKNETFYSLTMLIAKEGVDLLAALPDDDSRCDTVLQELDKIFSVNCSSKTPASESFVSMVWKDWGTDVNTRGGYTYATRDSHNMREKLRTPFYDNRMIIAGEATDTDHATVHGAINSGIKAAKYLLKTHKNGRK
eukprot:m.46146 g.46146  ORF g.46146 m.46146 type:complete len:472 (+) comp10342_c0_seq1:192-1607(+)